MTRKSVFTLLTLLTVVFAPLAASAQNIITTVVGGGPPDNISATEAPLNVLMGVATDNAGHLYITARDSHRVYRLDNATGLLTVFAGNGANGFSGDGGPATDAVLNSPQAVAFDSSGNIFILDSGNNRVRMVTPDGTIQTVAGNGAQGFGGDGGPATEASMTFPYGLAIDGNGNIFIADSHNNRIRMFTVGGTIQTVAGTGVQGDGGDGGPATAASFHFPCGVAVDNTGNIFVADTYNHRIRMFNLGGNIQTVAGIGTYGYNGDGGAATDASINSPFGLTVDSSGTIFIADSYNNRIRTFTVGGTIQTVAGNGSTSAAQIIDGVPAVNASVFVPVGVSVDSAGTILIAEQGRERVRQVSPEGIIQTIAGDGFRTYYGNNVPPRQAVISNYPAVSSKNALAFDKSGNLFIADSENNLIRKVDAAMSIITTVAGRPGGAGPWGDGGLAVDAYLNGPQGLAFNNAGDLFIADTWGHAIRKIDASTGIISTIAGNLVAGYSGDGILATQASLYYPMGLAIDSAGNLFIADAGNSVIRRVDKDTGIITTFAGTGVPDYSGDNGPATSATLNWPNSMAFDAAGNMYIADTNNSVIRKVDLSGIITTIAGHGGWGGYDGDGGSADSAVLAGPADLMVDKAGNLFFADRGNSAIRKITPEGIISTVVGRGNTFGDGGEATNAQLNNPSAIAGDSFGNLYIYDLWNARIRKVTNLLATAPPPPPAIGITPSQLSFGTDVIVGESRTQYLTIQNSGGQFLNINGITLTGNGSNSFQLLDSGSCPAQPFTLTNGNPCTVAVQYSGTVPGPQSASLVISDNVSPGTHSVGLTGTTLVSGPGFVSSASTIDFGSQVIGGSTAAQTVTLTNWGTGTLQISSLALSSGGNDFTLARGTCGTPSVNNPLNLASGQSCTVQVTFTPWLNSIRSGALSVTDNSAGSPHPIVLSAIGTLPPGVIAALPVGAQPKDIAVNKFTNKIYVVNTGSNFVTIIDGATNTAKNVPVGNLANLPSSPTAVAIDTVDNKVYVSVRYGLAVIDGVTDEASFISIPNNGFFDVAVNSRTHKVYLVNYDLNRVTVVDANNNNNNVLYNRSVGSCPRAAAVNEVTSKIYVADSCSVASVSVMWGPTDGVNVLQTGFSPYYTAVNPLTNKIYFTNPDANTVTVLDGVTNGMTTVPVGQYPWSMAVNPVTNKIYVANYNYGNGRFPKTTVSVIDGTSNTTTSVPVGQGPMQVAVDPVANKIYVANWISNDITVIDGVSNTPNTIASDISPYAVAVNEVTGLAYVANLRASGYGNLFVLGNAASTTTSLTANANPSFYGDDITFTATVTPFTATGMVTFTDASVVIGTGTLVNGVATLTVSGLSLGTHTITAIYSGDPASITSTSTVLTQVVNPKPLIITVTANDQSVALGDALPPLTYTLNPNVTLDSQPVCVSSVNSSAVGSYPGAITCSGAAKSSYAIKYVAGTLTVTGFPDLIINNVTTTGIYLSGSGCRSNIAIDDICAIAGATLTVNANIVDSSPAAAGPSTTQYYLSKDGIAKDLLLGEHKEPAISSFHDIVSSAGFTLPANSGGTYRVIACANGKNEVLESTTGNNCTASQPFTIYQPDLVVGGVTATGAYIIGCNPSQHDNCVIAGASLTISAGISDQSPAAAGPSTTLYYLSRDGIAKDLLLGEHKEPAISGIGTGFSSIASSANFTLPVNIGGTYSVIVCANGKNEVLESTTDNNCTASQPFTIYQPDLVVGGVTATGVYIPGSGCRSNSAIDDICAIAGASLSISAGILDQSPAAAGPSTTLYYLSRDGIAKDLLLGEHKEPAISSFHDIVSSAGFTLPANSGGTYRVIACANGKNEVLESTTGNNCTASQPFTIYQPDLVVGGVTATGVFIPGSGCRSNTAIDNICAIAGASLTINGNIVDSSPAAAGPSTTQYYLSRDGLTKDLLLGEHKESAISGFTGIFSTASFTLPANIGGTYSVIVCANGKNEVLESTTANNCTASQPFTIYQPDLLIGSNVTIVTAAPTAGSPITITAITANQSIAPAGDSSTLFYLSTDGIARGTLLGERLESPIAGNSASPAGNITVTLPATLIGKYYIIACADGKNQIVESNETNNCAASAPFTIGPDLTVDKVDKFTLQPVVGGQLSVAAVTLNKGTGAAGASSTLYYLSNDGTTKGALLGERSDGPLAAGGVSGASSLLQLPANVGGTYYIIACADGYNTVVETNETNNCNASAPFTITLPDLLIGTDLSGNRVTIGTPTPVAGGTINIYAGTVNTSIAPAGDSSTLFYLSTDGTTKGTLLGERSDGPIGANGFAPASQFTQTLPTNLLGTYYVIACADGKNQIVESNETNNCAASKPFTIGSDLTVDKVDKFTLQPVVGGQLSVAAVTLNKGTSAAGPSSTLYYLSNDGTTKGALLGERSDGPLAAGGVSGASSLLQLPANVGGTYYIIACADGYNTVVETNETNNCNASAPFTITLPDLLIGTDLSGNRVTIGTPTPVAGGTINIYAGTVNSSIAPAGDSSTLFYLSTDGTTKGTLLGERSDGPIGANGFSPSSQFTQTLPANLLGTYYIIACADGKNQIVESNETNNCAASKPFTIGPDLTLVDQMPSGAPLGQVYIATWQPVAGGQLGVTTLTRNQGSGTAGPSSTLYYLSSDGTTKGALLGERSDGPIAAGGVSQSSLATLQLPNNVGGNYYIIACADGHNTVAETDETNNCATSRMFTIALPTLTISASNQTVVYGGAIPMLTYTTTPNTTLDSPPTCISSVNGTSNAGNYPGAITCSGGTKAGYLINYLPGDLTIAKANLTVSANNKQRLYGASNPVLDGTLIGLLNGDTITATFFTPATAASPAGTYVILPSQLIDLNNRLANYTVSSNNAVLTVNKALLTVIADNKSMPFAGAVPALSASFNGFLNGDTLSVLTGAPQLSTTATSTSSAGTYPISVAQGTLSSANYDFNFVNGSLTVNVVAPVIQLVTTTNLIKQSDGTYRVTITVTNKGTAFAANVQITSASLGSSSISSLYLPIAFGTIAPTGGSATATAVFPAAAGASGTTVIIKYSGSYTGGTFSGSMRALLP